MNIINYLTLKEIDVLMLTNSFFLQLITKQSEIIKKKRVRYIKKALIILSHMKRNTNIINDFNFDNIYSKMLIIQYKLYHNIPCLLFTS